ncbi:MAG: TrmO family methyltransferase domain-containing protein [Methylocystis sp.]|uniref:TrmO family methyltransferase domain-containing protein n=1 Tax=Methylocystis sp. TaxID=1911079 RepID=UPI003DA2B0E1
MIFRGWNEARKGIERYPQLEVLYWFHQARQDLVLQSAHRLPTPRGTLSLRSPMRPNPIGSSVVRLESREGRRLIVC